VQKQGLTLTFPTLPSTISKVEGFIASRQTDPGPLIEIVEQDPSVSVNVLRRVNSPYHGLRREVESIDRAVRLLGFVEVSSIVMIEGVEELQSHFDSHPDLLRQIAHTAVSTGRFTQGLTKALDVSQDWTRLAFSAGFIHAMGRLVLLNVQPDRYETLAETSRRTSPPPSPMTTPRCPTSMSSWRRSPRTHRCTRRTSATSSQASRAAISGAEWTVRLLPR